MILDLVVASLILALVVGAVEVCIASYCIQKARRAESEARTSKEQALNCSEKLKSQERKFNQLCTDTVKIVLRLNKARILTTTGNLKGETQKKRISDTVGYLINIRSGINDSLDLQYLSNFIAELNSMPIKTRKKQK